MIKGKAVKPANDTAEPAVVQTPRGQVTFEDFSIEHMMASMDDDAGREADAYGNP